ALAANAVVDTNILSVGISKVTYGTSGFAGDVILSRGISQPVIVLQNSGLYLFGQANPTDGRSGLTSQPYAAITPSGISLFSGGNPSVTLTSAAVTLWSVNGSTGYPYVSLSSSALQITSGSFSTNISSSQIQMAYSGGPVMTLYASGLSLSSGVSSVTITSGSVAIANGSFSSVATAGGSVSIT